MLVPFNGAHVVKCLSLAFTSVLTLASTIVLPLVLTYPSPALCQDSTSASIVPIGTLVQPRTITTSGTADIEIAPDQVVMLLGIRTSHADLDQAKSQNDTRTRAVVSAAKAAGVAPARVQTGTISIQPRYGEKQEDYGKILAYVVERKVIIDLRDLTKFEDLISECVKSHAANYIHSVEFRTTELKKHRMQARTEAAKAAREKADALAAQLGVKVGPVRMINESSDSFASSRMRGYAQTNVMQYDPGSSGDDTEGGDTLAPGHLNIRSTVTVVFDLQ